MSEMCEYPEREYVELTDDFYAAMRFELSIHPDGEEFRCGIATITKLYEHSALLRSMQQMARFMSITHAAAGYEQYENTLDHDFYRGSALAMHTLLRVQPQKQRQQLLRTDLFADHVGQNFTYEFSSKDMETIIGGLTQWSQGAFMASLGGESDEFQELVIEAAMRMYDDVPNARANEDSFMSGFMMAKDQIVLATQHISKRTDYSLYRYKGCV